MIHRLLNDTFHTVAVERKNQALDAADVIKYKKVIYVRRGGAKDEVHWMPAKVEKIE
jgi:uncharacterized protein YcgI (DUF1989 family)